MTPTERANLMEALRKWKEREPLAMWEKDLLLEKAVGVTTERLGWVGAAVVNLALVARAATAEIESLKSAFIAAGLVPLPETPGGSGNAEGAVRPMKEKEGS